MSGQRVPNLGSRIDRKAPVRFTFNGRSFSGYAGDTLASALLAAGESLFSRSWKYHRPRGIVTSGIEEPSALVQVERGAHTIPNAKMPEVELYEGLYAESVNGWPGLLSRLLSPNRWGTPLFFITKPLCGRPRPGCFTSALSARPVAWAQRPKWKTPHTMCTRTSIAMCS